MSPEPLYLRFQNPLHRKFYEVEVELSLFYSERLVRRWGRIGTRRPRAIWRVMSDPDELARKVERLARVRQRHGYRTVVEVHAPSIAASAA